MRIFVYLSLLGLALLLTVASGAREQSIRYFDPDGKPVVDMPILYRMLEWNGELEKEISVRTDKDGIGKVEFTPRDDIGSHGNLLYTAPDGTLYLCTSEARFRNNTHARVDVKFTLIIRGTVVDADGHPAPGARVTLGSMILDRGQSLMELNRPSANLTTPTLVVTADEKGEFAFPPVTTTRKDTNPFKAAYLSAWWEQEGAVLAGETRVALTWRKLDAYYEALDAEPARITLQPTETIRGTVVHALTGAPVAGTAVCLISTPLTSGNNAIPAVQTNDLGEFVITGVLPGEKRLLRARKEEFGEGWTDLAAATNIALPPLVEVSGFIVDERTAAPPPIRTRLMFTTGREFGEDPFAPGTRREIVDIDMKDGSFSARLPVGPVSVEVYRYFSIIAQADGLPALMEDVTIPEIRKYEYWGAIPPEDLQDVQFVVKSQPYYHIFVDAGKEGADNCLIYFRKQGSEIWSQGGDEIRDGWWSWYSQTGWGESMEVLVKRWEGDYKLVDASPILTVNANPDEWPFVIVLKPKGQ